MAGPRYAARTNPIGDFVCEDCGVPVADTTAHTRMHSILSAQAWAIAVLITAHLGPRVHDKWAVKERIDSKKFDNWSADALAEVVKEMDDAERNSSVNRHRDGRSGSGD